MKKHFKKVLVALLIIGSVTMGGEVVVKNFIDKPADPPLTGQVHTVQQLAQK